MANKFTTITVPVQVAEDVKRIATEENRSMAKQVAEFVRQWKIKLDKDKNKTY